MSNENLNIDKQLRAFKRKYFLKELLVGMAIFAAVTLGTFYTFSLLEYSFRLNTIGRTILFFSFLTSFIILLYMLIIRPLGNFLAFDKVLNDEVAAKKIGAAFPKIGDRLVNFVQLKSSFNTSPLAQASITQRTGFFKSHDFSEAITLRDTTKYWFWAMVVIAIVAVTILLNPKLISSSSERIVQYNKEFAPEAPFRFIHEHQNLNAFKNEDYDVRVEVQGNALPEQVYLITSARRIKMQKLDNQSFIYTFSKIQQDLSYRFEAAGFSSSTYNIEVVNRPQLGDFNIIFQFPEYLNRQNERLENTGNFQVPEGTVVEWQMQPRNVNEASLIFFSPADTLSKEADNDLLSFSKQLIESSDYEITLMNDYSNNKEPIIYHAKVVEDQYPQIDVNFYQDTVLYSFVMMSGNLNDDHGLVRLAIFYRTIDNNRERDFQSFDLPLNKAQNSQSFNYEWLLDSLKIDEGVELQYYLQAWDNDAVNGNKTAKTGIYSMKIPDRSKIKEEISKSTEETQTDIDENLKRAREITKKIEDSNEQLKGKQQLNWQDEKKLEELIKERKELNKALEELKKQYEKQELKRERFSPSNEKLKEKSEKLQKLIDELMDEETRELYEELRKLLEKQKNVNDVQKLLNQMRQKENNLEKELERTLELFKKLKFDHKLQENIDDLKKLKEEQKELREETLNKNSDQEQDMNDELSEEETNDESANDDKNGENNKKEKSSDSKKKSSEELAEEQNDLKEEFQNLREEMKEMEEMNQELKNPSSLPEDFNEQQERVQQKMQNASEQLQNNQKKGAGKSQEQAEQQMEQMQQQMQQMQSSMEMQMMEENLNDLRHIVHNLLKLSFDQEKVMKEFADVNQSDPRFVTLSQQQLKIRDDSQIVQDSLLALAERVFQIQSFVTRELAEMNNRLDKTTEAIRDRKKPVAVAEQQFAMTSMNNLALLLDDVLQQMQNAMAEAKGQAMPSPGQKPGSQLSEMQQQLNQKMEDLKKSGKSGRALSEELAKLAAEQERIREALKELQEKYGNEEENGKSPGSGIPELMEETEMDLVRKQLTEETIRRQKQILTRLLEAEKSMRERELDDERKGETAEDIEREVPPAFEEYFKQKQKEIELLKTIPPKLFPYYRKEVNDYFKRLGEQPE